MINLLPQKEKNELLLSFIQKRLLVLLLGFLMAFSLFLASLFFIKGLLLSKQNNLKNIITEKESFFRAVYVQDFKTAMEEASRQFKAGQGLWQGQIFLAPFFETIYPLLPNDSYFSNLTAKKITQEPLKQAGAVLNRKIGEKFFNIAISGFSPTRESLFLFKQNLQDKPEFQSVNFALSSWVKPIDVDFSLNLEFPASKK